MSKLAMLVLAAICVAVQSFPGSRTGEAAADVSKDAEVFHGGVSSQYDDFLRSFSDVFDRMRQQMAYLLANIPSRAAALSPVNLGDGNTTSVSKVIDGHRYTVNETVYSGGGGGDTEAIFKVRVVDIRPADQPDKEVEPLADEDSIENDINRPFQKRQDNLETFSEEEHIDLSNDILVNELAAAEGRKPHPDSEWPQGLDGDIIVNKWAQQQGWTNHPDTEAIGPDSSERWQPEHERNAYPEHIETFHDPVERTADRFHEDIVLQDVNGLLEGDAEMMMMAPPPSSRYYYGTAADR